MSARAKSALARSLVLCGAAVLMAGCAHTVGGTAVRPVPGIDDDSRSSVDVDTVLLEQSQMRAITGAGEDLTIIPSMDGKFPVDIEALLPTVPPQCGWVYAETQTFGPDVEEFHKTTFQNPPEGGLISQGAAGYRDPVTARRAFDGLVAHIDRCDGTGAGPSIVGDWTASDDAAQTRPGGCGRDYRLKSVVLVEVTFCSFPDSVPDIVMTNILARIRE
ncbi:sensor domain-containing protein [Mycobacterium sp. CPCC 205372]|uniref:Sensor domain-containing protein n=1 Tax=Mycobacterium hippophais TaxID=3016340 RepID=A0ABT4PV63_9MYCO|nr:sensor domain-containing protein [Mycobacterium hippophais]MCZ8380435.1 sensor domain-containing protein [Mycobacterium hippophais]